MVAAWMGAWEGEWVSDQMEGAWVHTRVAYRCANGWDMGELVSGQMAGTWMGTHLFN